MSIPINTANLASSTITSLCIDGLTTTNSIPLTNLTTSNLYVTGTTTVNVNSTNSVLSISGTSVFQNLTAVNLSVTNTSTAVLAVTNIVVGTTTSGIITMGDSTFTKASGSEFIFGTGINSSIASQDLGTTAAPWARMYGTTISTSNLNITSNIIVPRVFVQAAAIGTYYTVGSNYYTPLWNTTTFQPTTAVFNSGNFNATNGRITVPYDGLYAVTFSMGVSAIVFEPYIASNTQSTNDLNAFPPNSTTGRLCSAGCNAMVGDTLHWTGYITTSDYINCGFYTGSTPSIIVSRTGVAVALIYRM